MSVAWGKLQLMDKVTDESFPHFHFNLCLLIVINIIRVTRPLVRVYNLAQKQQLSACLSLGLFPFANPVCVRRRTEGGRKPLGERWVLVPHETQEKLLVASRH